MERNTLFLLSAVVIVLAIVLLFMSGVIGSQAQRIADLMATVDSYSSKTQSLQSLPSVSCDASYFATSGGKGYLSASATASADGVVTLTIENLRAESLRVMNIKEVKVLQDDDGFIADYSKSPSFRDPSGNSSCGGTLALGEKMQCTSAAYSDDVAAAVEGGAGAFMIKYVKAEVSAEPYVVLAENVCVRLS